MMKKILLIFILIGIIAIMLKDKFYENEIKLDEEFVSRPSFLNKEIMNPRIIGRDFGVDGGGNIRAVNIKEITGLPITLMATNFESSGRFVSTVLGSGSNTFGDAGIAMSTGATISSSANVRLNLAGAGAGYIFAGNPGFAVSLESSTLNTSVGSAFFGIGTPTVDGSGHSFNMAHIGFKIIGDGTILKLYATQANGTTETAVDLNADTVGAGNIGSGAALDLLLKVNGLTSVEYFYRKLAAGVIGDFIGPVILTSSMPTAFGSTGLQWSASNNATANSFAFTMISSSYSRR